MLKVQPALQTWQVRINQGVAAIKAGRYADAVAAFRQAVALHATDPIPHLYLAGALAQQFTPEAIPPLNPEMGEEAEREFERVLELDPKNWPALVMLGQLMRQQSQFPEARAWYRKALDLDTNNADIWCVLGAMSWRQLRGSRTPNATLIDEGVSRLNQALTLDPRHDAAMEWISLLLRERSDAASISAADGWRKLSETVREEKNRLAATGVRSSWPPALAGTWQVLRDWARSAVSDFPPLPPPPPPSQDPFPTGTSWRSSGAWTFRYVPADDRSPDAILVDPNIQERNLIKKVPANISSTVRVHVVIADDGRVKSAKFLSGDRALENSALAAVRQWVYRPTISNWKPVEVVTEAVVPVQ